MTLASSLLSNTVQQLRDLTADRTESATFCPIVGHWSTLLLADPTPSGKERV